MIEHLFFPANVFARSREALTPGGHIVLSTPFHSYWKGVALAVSGKLERHWTPEDYGHIKFFSEDSLTRLAKECGFEPTRLQRAGRIRPLAATMVLTARCV